MTKTKLNNCFTQVDNHLLETVMQSRLSSLQIRILLTIIRCTYGWHREHAELSVRFIGKKVKYFENKVCEALKEMINKNIVIVSKNWSGKNGRYLKINPKIDKWDIPIDMALLSKKKIVSPVNEELPDSMDEKYISKQELQIKNTHIMLNTKPVDEMYEKIFGVKKTNLVEKNQIARIIHKVGIDVVIKAFKLCKQSRKMEFNDIVSTIEKLTNPRYVTKKINKNINRAIIKSPKISSQNAKRWKPEKDKEYLKEVMKLCPDKKNYYESKLKNLELKK